MHRIALLCKFSTVPRTLRMAKILADAGYIVHIIEWDRTSSKPRIEIKDGIVFKRLRLKASYGLSTIHLTPFWAIFVLIQIILGDYHIVQPQNLDCLMPAFFYVKFVRHRRIIYDLADFYSDAFVVGIPIVSRIAKHLERLSTRCIDALILASERQILQVEARNLPEKVVTFYNAPDIDFSSSACAVTEDNSFAGKKNENCFTLFYAGQLSYDRVRLLLNVMNVIKGLPVEILIAGYGQYEDFVRHLSEDSKQISFLGFLNQKEVMRFSRNADLILLPYDPGDFNNKIGLPSKLFESMACGALVLAPLDTYMAEIVEREKIGFVADYDSLKDIWRALKLVMGGEKSDIQLRKQNAEMLYIEKFSPKKLGEVYISVVESMCSK